MNDTIKYQWSKKLGQAAAMAVHTTSTMKSILKFISGSFLLYAGVYNYTISEGVLPLAFCFLGTIMVTEPFLLWIIIKKRINDISKTFDSLTVILSLTNESLKISHDNDSRTITWDKIIKCYDKQGFLVLYTGSVYFASLPKQHLSEKQIRFIKSVSSN